MAILRDTYWWNAYLLYTCASHQK